MFWDSLFKNASDWGLTTFKLDHAQSQVPNMIVTQRDLYTVDTWLTTMTNAAAKHGISKQFGGCVSSMFLHSVSLPSVHSARVGADYIPSAHRPPNTCTTVNGGQEDQLWEASSRGGSSHDYRQRAYRQSAGVGSAEGSATLGRNSLVPWSLGILPYKDATFTGPQKWSDTTCLMPAGRTYTMPEWYGLQGECCSRSFSCHESHAITQDSAVLHIGSYLLAVFYAWSHNALILPADPFPELGVVVSAMAAGPIASCDGVGDFNVSLLMRVARADGILLKPQRPAIALDAQWFGDLFCKKGGSANLNCSLCSPTGEVSETFTQLLPNATQRWHFVLG